MTLFLIAACPLIWEATVDRLFSAMGIEDTRDHAGRYMEISAVFAMASDDAQAGRESGLDQAARTKRSLNRRHFATVCWTTVGLFILLAVIWPPAGIVWRRFKKAALAFLVLAVILSLCGWRLQEHFASVAETTTLVLGFSACATFGMPFTATLADKLLAAHKAPGVYAPAILNGVIGAGLGMILFMAGMYLVIFHTNAQHLNYLGI